MSFRKGFVVVFAILVMVLVALPSWSSEPAAGHRDPSAVVLAADTCLPLLVRKSASPADPVLGADRAAAEIAPAAVLGLMLGVRYAVGPVETAPSAAAPSATHAQAIASYRHCRSQQTLESLASAY